MKKYIEVLADEDKRKDLKKTNEREVAFAQCRLQVFLDLNL